MAHPYDLPSILHRNLNSLPPCQNLLIRDIVVAWSEVRKYLGVSPHISPYLLIHGKPMFPQSTQHKSFPYMETQSLNQSYLSL